ncbi:MAG: DUF2249 domain-containing protein [Bacteroidetes bacterium]|nr:DUF2249 domain-containing protein [Bacteroidota bacterium]
MAKEITSKTTIKELLADDRDSVIDALVKFNSNFSKLRNPILRNLMSRRVTIADACKIAGCRLQDFMENICALGFTIGTETGEIGGETETTTSKKASNFVALDVRPILAENRDPLKTILNAINNLRGEEGLKLINTFEPVPLIHLLSEKGFTHFVVKPDANTVVTYFNRIIPGPEVTIDSVDREYASSLESFDNTLKKFGEDQLRYIDVRGLEMPGPMVTILQNLQSLKDNTALFVHHKRRPVFLMPELEKRGYKYLFKDASGGDVDMLIFKP